MSCNIFWADFFYFRAHKCIKIIQLEWRCPWKDLYYAVLVWLKVFNSLWLNTKNILYFSCYWPTHENVPNKESYMQNQCRIMFSYPQYISMSLGFKQNNLFISSLPYQCWWLKGKQKTFSSRLNIYTRTNELIRSLKFKYMFKTVLISLLHFQYVCK